MDKELVARIRSRQRTLNKARKALKAHFVGIDDIIDRIIKDVETWYVMPELLTRPTIVCLWGPTGVGKTDLVRRLVKLLQVQDKFCELTLSNKGCPSYPWCDSIASVLRHSNVESGEQSVMLMDEIQGFRTKDEEGHDIHDCKFKDVWTLLSDGKLPYHVEVENLMSMLWDFQKKDVIPPKAPKGLKVTTTKKKKHKSVDSVLDEIMSDEDDDEKHSFWQLNQFKSLLRLDEPIEEIALWSDTKRKNIIMKRLNDKSIFEEEDYTKCLIFVSGNLDEAYGFTRDVKEVDCDADILHEMSKKISILDIKQALTKRFKPEQISRMGNEHVVYPSLSKNSFKTIIERKIKNVQERVLEKTGITVEIDSSIHTLIYNNGVFPTQGTRPLFSTISDVLENSLPKFLLQAILKNSQHMKMFYKNNAIECTFENYKYKRKYIGAIDKLKNERRSNICRRTLTSVHEAGHAVLFAKLFKISPAQIVAAPASNDTEGFVYTIQSCQSRDMAMKRLCVILAGQVSEQIIFGRDNVTSGSSSDLEKATEMASQMVRKWGMGSFVSVIAPAQCELLNNDQDGSNDHIEALLQACKQETIELVNDNIAILEDTVDRLLVEDKIEPKEFIEICANRGLEIGQAVSTEDIIYWDYNSQYKKFKKLRNNT